MLQLAKPFLEPKTQEKVKFVYSDNPSSKQIVEDLFDMNLVESAFGGKDDSGFNINKYAERMREDDKKKLSFWTGCENPPAISQQPSSAATTDSSTQNADSNTSDNDSDKIVAPSSPRTESIVSPDVKLPVTEEVNNNVKVH